MAAPASLPLRLWANAHVERRGAYQRGFVLDCVGAQGGAVPKLDPGLKASGFEV